ncbi:MAG TPA: type IV pilus assembly protein PilM [Candidatus Pacearchaeota archaeon]|nr:type IV pilus assembly protein PilM [Candidatus Pacearchaeota archaeon]HQI74770.1 type IV pilus assembly protein PilM [Candidatus Pacearchaeota archaeon]
MSFFNFQQDIFGIDISDTSFKIAKLSKNGKFFRLESYGSFNVPKDIIVDGQIKNIDLLSELTKNALPTVKGKKITSKYVALALPEEKTFLRVIETPDISACSLNEAAKFEAEKYIPIPINDVYIDCGLVDSESKKYLLLAAVAKETADSYALYLEKAGLEPIVFEPKTQAISRSLIPGNFSDAPILILDMGARRTNILVFYKDAVNFSATINLSANNLTQNIAQEIGVSFKEAEQLKIRNQNEKAKYDKRIEIAINDFIIDLASQIRGYINFYNEKPYSPKEGIKRVIISGGGANLFSIKEKISSALGIETEIGNPWINILPQPVKEIPYISFQESQAYSVALGLALRGIKFEI